MNFLDNPWVLVAGVGVAIALHVIGVKALAPKTSQHPAALWTAFAVEAIAGLVLGVALYRVMSWLTSLSGAGAVLGAIGSIIALTLGWQAVKMLVAMFRDLADGKPDAEARKAALWVPTLIPAGWAAVVGLVSNPRGLGGGIVAAIMGAITLGYCFSIIKEALKSKKHQKAWLWFAAAVSLLAGLVLITLIAYIDDALSNWLSGGAMGSLRVIGGAIGAALGVAAIADFVDKRPDEHVRRFAMFGLPLLYLFGSLMAAWLGDNASSGLDLISGSIK